MDWLIGLLTRSEWLTVGGVVILALWMRACAEITYYRLWTRLQALTWQLETLERAQSKSTAVPEPLQTPCRICGIMRGTVEMPHNR